jgi:hypothetical protein
MDEIAEDDDLENADEKNQMLIIEEKPGIQRVRIEPKAVASDEEKEASSKVSKIDNDFEEEKIEEDIVDTGIEAEIDKALSEDLDEEIPNIESDETVVEDKTTEVEEAPINDPTEEIFKVPYVGDDEIVEEELPLSDEEFVEELFKNIPMKMSDFYTMYEDRGEEIPIFNYINTLVIVQRITCMGDEDLTAFSKLLKNRARLKIISLEIANLQKIGKNSIIQIA